MVCACIRPPVCPSGRRGAGARSGEQGEGRERNEGAEERREERGRGEERVEGRGLGAAPPRCKRVGMYLKSTERQFYCGKPQPLTNDVGAFCL